MIFKYHALITQFPRVHAGLSGACSDKFPSCIKCHKSEIDTNSNTYDVVKFELCHRMKIMYCSPLACKSEKHAEGVTLDI